MKAKAADFLIYDEATKTYHENPEQAVRDDVEKHYWLHVGNRIDPERRRFPWPNSRRRRGSDHCLRKN
jgi:putative aldouronate transport system permease protein